MSTLKVNTLQNASGGNSIGNVGKIIQVVSTVKKDTASSTVLNDAADPYFFLTLNITPASASNKILIYAYATVGSSGGTTFRYQINRDSTPVDIGDTGDASESRATSGTNIQETWEIANIATMNLDSPSTTSQITYKLGLSNGTSGYTWYINRSSTDGGRQYVRGTSGILLMEVAA